MYFFVSKNISLLASFKTHGRFRKKAMFIYMLISILADICFLYLVDQY